MLQAAGLDDAEIAAEQQIARASTVAALPGLNGSQADHPAHLCCGVLGLTSLLRIDAAISGIDLAPQVPAVEARLIRQGNSNGYTFFSVDAGTLNLPGLLTGQAGAALALLEAADGLRWLPSVLSAGLLPAP